MKKLALLLLCSIVLAGCAQDVAEGNMESVEVQDVAEDTATTVNDQAEDMATDEEETEEVVEDDGMMDYTMYTGEVVSIAEDGFTTVFLDAEQVIPVDTMEFVFSDGTVLCIPAANLSACVKDFDNAVSNGSVEYQELDTYKDYMHMMRIRVPGADWSDTLFIENAEQAETVDIFTLPVTGTWGAPIQNGVTINGFLFNVQEFSMTDLVAAWGNPIQAHIEGDEGEVGTVDYYWRFNNGYVELTVEEDKPDNLGIYQWDTLIQQNDHVSREFPKYGE